MAGIDTSTLTAKDGGDLVIKEEGGTTLITIKDGAEGPQMEGAVKIKESAAAPGDTAAYGQLWVKNDTPNNLYFVNDAGNEVQITNGSSLAGVAGSLSGLGSTDNVILRTNGTGGETAQGSGVVIDDSNNISGVGTLACGAITSTADTATFTSANADDPLVVIKNTASDATGARLQFVKDKGAEGADGDDIGVIEFVGDNSAQEQTSFAKILAEVSESLDGDEAGKLSFFVAESNDSSSQLTAGLVLEGEHATDGEVDVTIAAGTASTTTVAGSAVITTDLTVSGGDIKFGNGQNATIDVDDVSGTDTAGKNLTLLAGAGTGTGQGGSIIFQTAKEDSGSGSSVNAHATALEITRKGDSVFSGDIEVTSNGPNGPSITIENTNSGANAGFLQFKKILSGNADDNDKIGTITFTALDDGDNETIYASIEAVNSDETDGTEDGKINFNVMKAGTSETLLAIEGTIGETQVNRNFGMKTDGAIMKFGADSEVTLTHVHDTGLLLSDASGIGTTQLQFGDSGTFIRQSSDGVLNLSSDGSITFTTDTATFSSANANDPNVQIVNATNDANGAILQFVKDKGAAGSTNDVNGLIQFIGDDANQELTMFSEIKSQVKVATNGQEGGKFTVSVASHDGTPTAGLVLEDGTSSGQIDVTIGAGSSSKTEVKGELVVDGNKIETGNSDHGSINPSDQSGTNQPGLDFQISGGKSTGNEMGGDIVFKTASPGASGTSTNNTSTVAVINGDGFLGIGYQTIPESTLDVGGGYHIATEKVIINKAHNGDNTVAVETKILIPAFAIITEVAVVVKEASNLSTALYNVQMSATAGTAADSAINSGTELLGAGVTNTISTDSASAEDINVKEDKEVFLCRDSVRNGSSDQFVYICNAGTGNGTVDPSAGQIYLIVKYYGRD